MQYFFATLAVFSALASPPVQGTQPRHGRLNLAHGLSQSTVLDIVQSSQGFLFFGTFDGLNRYDGKSMVVYRQKTDNPNSLPDNVIKLLHPAPDGNLFVVTAEGFGHFNPNRDRFQKINLRGEVQAIAGEGHGPFWGATATHIRSLKISTSQGDQVLPELSEPIELGAKKINDIAVDQKGKVWIASDRGLIWFSPSTGRFNYLLPQPEQPTETESNHISFLYLKDEHMLRLGTRTGKLYRFNSVAQSFHIETAGALDPGHIPVSGLIDNQGRLWVGTKENGLYMEDGNGFIRHGHQPDSNAGSVKALFLDHEGTVWVGTRDDGLHFFSLVHRRFQHFGKGPNGLSNNSVLGILEDGEGDIWVGTSGGGVNRIKNDSGQIEQFLTALPKTKGASSPVDRITVNSIFKASNQDIWLGTDHGLARFVRHGKRFEWVKKDKNGTPFGEVSVMAQKEGQDHLWVGTRNGALYYDPDENLILKHLTGESDEWQVKAIHFQADGSIWFGGYRGLDHYQPQTDTWLPFRADSQNPNSLSHDTVNDLYIDQFGTLWIATSYGLNRFNAQTQSFQVWTKEDGLAHNLVYCILEDDNDELWLSTNRGLSRFDPVSEVFRNYDVEDGLQGNEFNVYSAAKSDDGLLYFGGINGLNRFDPLNLEINEHHPKIVITDFLVSDPWQTNGTPKSWLKDWNGKDPLILSHRDTEMTFQFTALSFAAPGKNSYEVRLDGFEPHWKVPSSNNQAEYTNLDPGEYTFRVTGKNNDGKGDLQAALPFVVLPAPWFTWWAWSIYALIAVTAFVLFWSRQHRHLAREREVVSRLKEVDRLKDDFLANTSHELRTPLHGVIGLAESLIAGSADQLPPESLEQIRLIANSGKRLSALVDDLLDYASLKNRGIQLEPKPLRLKPLVDAVLALNRPQAQDRGLRLNNQLSDHLPPVFADENRLLQILHNLIGNGVKFTTSGDVSVAAEVVNQRMEIRVTDTGPGIPETEKDQIFHMFQRGSAATNQVTGTGLGLTVTRYLIQLHGGDIQVTSTPGEGSTFVFTLPLATEKASVATAPVIKPGKRPVLEKTQADSPPDPAAKGKKGAPHILIVDDEPINRQVLRNYLALAGYHISETAHGKGALAFLEKQDVDLILLDIMMPDLSGYEVCRLIREKRDAQSLPIIFLTARAGEQDLSEGFQAGANDYLTKPVGHNELNHRVDTLLKLADAHHKLVAEHYYLVEEISLVHRFDRIVSKSPAYAKVLQRIERVAPSNATVLITGETGTGKELLAQAVHDLSPRCKQPLIKVNCAALPAELIESELFGHERGAFTGATGRKRGRFELAHGGTLFLDEIGEMPLALQPKLLRVLTDGRFERVGGNHSLIADFRLVAATNRDLEQEVAEGRFREDLFFRLNVVPVANLPLRERADDIPLLTRHFIEKFDSKGRIKTVQAGVLARLQAYEWPGNVRELANVVERAVILSNKDHLDLTDWSPLKKDSRPPAEASLAAIEREHILRVLELTHWRIRGKDGTAEVLDLKPTTLEARMKKLGIERPGKSPK